MKIIIFKKQYKYFHLKLDHLAVGTIYPNNLNQKLEIIFYWCTLHSIFFYEETTSGGFEVYESYAVRGGSPVTKRLFEWNSGR